MRAIVTPVELLCLIVIMLLCAAEVLFRELSPNHLLLRRHPFFFFFFFFLNKLLCQLTTNWFCCRWLPILRVLLPLVTRHWCLTRFDTAGQCVKHVKHWLLPFYLLLTWQSPFMTSLLHWLAFFFWACSGCVLLPQDLIFPFQTLLSISTSNASSPNLHHRILYSVDDGFDSTTTISYNLVTKWDFWFLTTVTLAMSLFTWLLCLHRPPLPG